MSESSAIPLPPKKESTAPNRRRKRRRWRWLLKASLYLFVFGLILAVVGGTIAYFYAKPRYELAQTFDLEKIDDLEVASMIFDRHGTEIGRIFVQNRQPIPIEEVPPHFVQAIMAAEDARFYSHNGVDYIGILRAVVLNLKEGEITSGASTITQQLARNAFDLKEKSISRKVTEAFLAQRIEKTFEKDEILELYLNRIYFGSGYYGISAAAKGYFGKEAKDLTIPESATLAGVVRNPYYRSPYNFPDASKNTRDYVLNRMEQEGFITEEQLEKFHAEPLQTVPKISAAGRSKFVYEHVRQRVIDLIGAERASQGGFLIATTIDNRVQRAAEENLRRQLSDLEQREGYPHQTLKIYKALKEQFRKTNPDEEAKPPPPDYLQGAALMIENRTGAIVALVGGRDFNDSMYDRTTQSRRPSGTAFTPFVYATAFQSGLFPGTLVEDTPIDNKFVQIGGEAGILGEWGVESFENVYENEITARVALAKSKNAAAVRMGMRAGLEKVVALGESAGIEFRGDMRNYNGTFLGRNEASMTEMCLAYTMFPNGGGHADKTFMISSIADRAGNEIYAPDPVLRDKGSIDAYTAYQVTSCLSDALQSGTGRKAYSEYGLRNFPAAGKTGTEYDFTDNWFVGFTSEVTCAVWAGFDQPKRIYRGAFSNETVLPVWSAMMNAAVPAFEPREFEPPSEALQVEICSLSGELATDACFEVDQSGSSARHVRSTYIEFLRPGTEVTNVCNLHGAPGAKPRTVPKLSPGSLTLPSRMPGPGPRNGGPLIARAVVTSDPVIPIAPTVIGEDPYDSLAPKIVQQVMLPDVLKEVPDESEKTEDETVEPSEVPMEDPLPKFDIFNRPIARPLTATPLTAVPLEQKDPAEDPAPTEEPSVENRVRLTPPKPIEFD